MVDSVGVVYEGRKAGDEPVEGAVRAQGRRRPHPRRRAARRRRFLGLSKAGLCTAEMLKTMATKPMVFALANPDPEIGYAEAKAARPDAIVATGRSDFPNQVNNVLGFPYIFRGALDVRAKEINETMKVAAAHALAALAHEPVPDLVAEAYGVQAFKFGPDYLIPKPFDTRVLWWVRAGRRQGGDGVGRRAPDAGSQRVPRAAAAAHRRRPAEHHAQIVQRAKSAPKRIVFPEGDSIKVLRACQIVLDESIARPVLLGNGARSASGPPSSTSISRGVEILDPADSPEHAAYAADYCRFAAAGASPPPPRTRLVNRRIHFGMMMVKRGDADGLVAGLTPPYPDTIRPALQILGIRPDVRRATGMYIMLLKNDVKFFADATVNIDPDAETLADMAIQVADAARAFEVVPRIAMISFSNFGSAPHPESRKMAEAVELVRKRRARSGDRRRGAGRHRGRTGEAARAVPVHPPHRRGERAGFPDAGGRQRGLQGLAALGGATAVGPILLGVNKPVTVLPRDANVDTIVSMTAYTVARGQS